MKMIYTHPCINTKVIKPLSSVITTFWLSLDYEIAIYEFATLNEIHLKLIENAYFATNLFTEMKAFVIKTW